MEDREIRIFFGIPTVPERMAFANELANEMKIPKQNVFLDAGHNGCLWNKMRIYNHVLSCDEEYTHVCINDDDSIVCKDYTDIVQKIVKKHPKAILTFYNNSIKKAKSPYVRLKNCDLSGTAFVIPKEYLNEYNAFYMKNLARRNFDWEETVTKMFALLNDIEVILIVPNLVNVRKGLKTVARKGNYIQPQSVSWVHDFPEESLNTDFIDEKGTKLFNLHLPKDHILAETCRRKFEAKKAQFENGGSA